MAELVDAINANFAKKNEIERTVAFFYEKKLNPPFLSKV